MWSGRLLLNRKCTPAIILSVIVVTGFATKLPAQSNVEPSVLVTLTPAETRLIRATLRAYGTTQADTNRQASIVIPRQGIVGQVSARLGEIVPAGAALVEVDTAPAATVAYEQAHAALKLARFEAQRIGELWNKRLTTHDRYAATQRDLADAEAKFAAQRQLGTGESRQVLRAPFEGIVNRLAVAAGDRVAADTPALSIVPRDAIVVPLGIEPEDASKLRPMMKVEIRSVFASSTQSLIPGEIASMQGIVSPTTGLVDALVRVKAHNAGGLLIGTRVEGTVVLSEQKMVAVPRSAVLNNAGEDYVFVVRNGRAHRVSIETGPRDGEFIGVTDGLAAGEQVVSRGNYELTDGMAVRIAKS